ncbi:hypothetical protein FEM33_23150 [Dyadobacter flavalbus]|uniref:Uncharacterized protein n=1 Tax=Dyadobacter flavalbus TaxID=2579942 RepID=A0A5M8QCE3_9BACT|nr:hypothetical protein [Dyadobacter flavalbus]KAA6432624.1 hypothetical protein FEM33_23150 [Dyadobacter flavalbus]
MMTYEAALQIVCERTYGQYDPHKNYDIQYHIEAARLFNSEVIYADRKRIIEMYSKSVSVNEGFSFSFQPDPEFIINLPLPA